MGYKELDHMQQPHLFSSKSLVINCIMIHDKFTAGETHLHGRVKRSTNLQMRSIEY